MGKLPAPKRPKRNLDLPPPPPKSEEETAESEFDSFLAETQSWEEVYNLQMNLHAAEMRGLGLSEKAFKAALKARGVDLESSMGGRLEVPQNLRERWDKHYAEMTRPAREKIERAATAQIRKEANQRDLEALVDLHERGVTKGHPLEPLLNKLFEKEQENDGTI